MAESVVSACVAIWNANSGLLAKGCGWPHPILCRIR